MARSGTLLGSLACRAPLERGEPRARVRFVFHASSRPARAPSAYCRPEHRAARADSTPDRLAHCAATFAPVGGAPTEEPFISRFEAPCSRFEAPCSRFEAPCSRFEAPCSRFEAPLSRFEAPCSRFEAPLSRFEASSARKSFTISLKEDWASLCSARRVTDQAHFSQREASFGQGEASCWRGEASTPLLKLRSSGRVWATRKSANFAMASFEVRFIPGLPRPCILATLAHRGEWRVHFLGGSF